MVVLVFLLDRRFPCYAVANLYTGTSLAFSTCQVEHKDKLTHGIQSGSFPNYWIRNLNGIRFTISHM